tara:strand:+ start:1602 stop:1724 length:123 start_codon:yes stop_codon:yes gene_type:complete
MDKREKMKLKEKLLLESKKPKTSNKKNIPKETPKKESKLE